MGPGLISALVLLYYAPLLSGSFPVSHDHPAHMFNAWLTTEHLLPTGRLSGWTDLWFAGYPANELYGPGGNLWVGLFRYATFSQLDYGATYGLAIFGLLWLVPMSTYALGRAFIGRTAATIGGLLIVTTKGSWYDLGYFWILEMGVWPFALGAALTLLAIVILRRYLRNGGPRGLAAAGAAFAVAIMGHPMSLLLLGFMGPVVLGCVLLEQGRRGATRVLLRGLGAAALGVGLAAFWLFPFVAKSAYSQKLGETWMELPDLFSSVVQLHILGAEWRLVLALSAVGLVIALARRHVWVVCLATCSMVMLMFSSSTTLYHLRLFDVASPLASIQYPRFLGVSRVFVYLLCGYAVRELWTLSAGLRARLRVARYSERVRSAALLVVPAALLAPMVLIGAPDYVLEHHYPSPEALKTQREVRWWGDYLAAAEYVSERLEGEPWSRVGAFGQPFGHMLATLPIYTGLPVYTGGFLPAHTYRFFFAGHRDSNTLRAVGVRYVLSTSGWGAGRADAELREVFGLVHVYELVRSRPARASVVGHKPEAETEPSCAVRTLRATDESLLLVVTGVHEPCRVRVHRSDFPNWSARLGGRELAIERIASYRGSHYAPFMSVVARESGVLELRWGRTRSDTLGLWLSRAAWLVLFALVLIGLRRRWWSALKGRLPGPSPTARRWGARAVWAGVAVVIIAGVALAAGRAAEERYTFDRHLRDAEKTLEREGKRIPCPAAERGDGWQCGEGWDRVRAGLFSFVYDSRYCIYAHPSQHGHKHLTFRDVPLRTRLSGFYGLLDSSKGHGDVYMDVSVGDAPPIRLTAREVGRPIGFHIPTEPGVADVDIRVTAESAPWRHFCFNMQVTGE